MPAKLGYIQLNGRKIQTAAVIEQFTCAGKKITKINSITVSLVQNWKQFHAFFDIYYPIKPKTGRRDTEAKDSTASDIEEGVMVSLGLNKDTAWPKGKMVLIVREHSSAMPLLGLEYEQKTNHLVIRLSPDGEPCAQMAVVWAKAGKFPDLSYRLEAPLKNSLFRKSQLFKPVYN